MAEISSAKLSIDVDLLPSGASARVLDVGCGDGRHLRAAAARGGRAIGVDYDADALRSTRTALDRARIDLIVGDASHLPFRAGTFDTVICTETLEHLPDDAGAMREIARVLADAGTLLGAVPTHFTERLYWRLSRGYREAPGGHVRIYTPRDLVSRLRCAGLRVSDARYAHFVDSIVWLRYCVTDALRPARPRSDYEAAIMLAVAAERPVPTWRTALRRAIARSRFIAAIDAAGALLWPKSLLFVARKHGGSEPSRRAGQALRLPASRERDAG
jgi:SAM-dependent methyltransferase